MLEELKKTPGQSGKNPAWLLSQLPSDYLLALLEYQASGELNDPRVETELYSFLLGINENYIDRSLLDISLKNDKAIQVLYNLRHEQLIYKMNLMKQQLTLKTLLERQLRSQQMNKLKLAGLLRQYEQQLILLLNNYQTKLGRLQAAGAQLTPALATNSQLLSTQMGTFFLLVFY